MRIERRGGFTLLEVLIAMFVLALAIGGLITAMAQNFQRLADARQDLEQLELAEAQVREIDEDAQNGVLPELGHSTGTFDPPHESWAWDLTVEPWAVPLPEGYAGKGLPSSVFQAPNTNSAVQPSVRMLSYRIYPADGSPDASAPYVAFVVEKVPPELAAQANGAEAQGAGKQAGKPVMGRKQSKGKPLGSGATNPVQGASR